MIQIVYSSAASVPFPSESLHTLLAKSRSRNSLYGVSGMLLYHAGSFLQVLEGPEDGVDVIYTSIERDPRHNNTQVLNRQAISAREFPEWSMGYIDTTPAFRPIKGKIDYSRDLASLLKAPTSAKRYLRLFQDGLCRQGTAA